MPNAALQLRLVELERNLYAVKKEAREREMALQKTKAQFARFKVVVATAALILFVAGACWFAWSRQTSPAAVAARDREIYGDR